MGGYPQIKVKMLGQFTLQEEGMSEPQKVNLAGRASRLWTLVAYLIIHRDRGVSAQELIDLLWPESGSSNPVSTLQNNASRARSSLGALKFTDAKGLIRHEDGCYIWAPDRDTWFDADVFEKLVEQAMAEKNPKKFQKIAKEAILLYEGDFLPEAASELWCVNLNTYYRSLYFRICKKTAHVLMEMQNYQDVVLLCTRVVQMDPMAEEFSILLMRALIHNMQPQRALEHYERMRKFYDEEYGVVPSPEMETEKRAAIQQIYGNDMDEEQLRTFLMEDSGDNTAFCCDNTTFREITKLQLRTMRRNNTPAQLLMLCLEDWETQPEKNAVYMQQMKLTLQDCLRGGDPFTQLGASQFWVLLPSAQPQDEESIFSRIRENLYRRFPKTKAMFRFKMIELQRILDFSKE